MITFAVQKDHSGCSMEKGFAGRKIRKSEANYWAITFLEARMNGVSIGLISVLTVRMEENVF